MHMDFESTKEVMEQWWQRHDLPGLLATLDDFGLNWKVRSTRGWWEKEMLIVDRIGLSSGYHLTLTRL